MSLENIVIAVSLLLGIVLLILIIYLISRVNDLEARAFSNQSTASTEKKTEAESLKVFAGLSGRGNGLVGHRPRGSRHLCWRLYRHRGA